MSQNGWVAAAANASQYLQVDLGSKKLIGEIATAGRKDVAQWVITYQISYSNDGVSFIMLPNVFNGNTNQFNVVTNKFPAHFYARYVRIIPLTWYAGIGLRWELFSGSLAQVELWFKEPIEFTQKKLTSLRQTFDQFCLVPKFTQYNIAVFGGVGVGKSSFHQSLQMARTGKMYQHALVRAGNSGSITTQLTKYPLNPRHTHIISIWDLPGFIEGKTYLTDQFSLILRGHCSNGYDPNRSQDEQENKYTIAPTFKDRVHVVILLINVTQIDNVGYIQDMQRHIKAADINRIPVVVGLTYVDNLDSEIIKDPSLALRSVRVKDRIDELSAKLGLQRNAFLPIVNAWTHEIENTLARDILIYSLLARALDALEGSFFYDPYTAEKLEKYLQAQEKSGPSSSTTVT